MSLNDRQMRKFLLVAVTTFVLGLLGTYIYFQLQLSDAQATTTTGTLSVPEVISCTEPRSFPGLSREVSNLTRGKSGYFQKDEFKGKWVERDDFINDWYGKHLRAMQESSLMDSKPVNEIYRFLWLRTFDHPIAVRIEKSLDRVSLSLVELDGRGGYDPGKVMRHETKPIDNLSWCEFLTLLDKARFWSLGSETDDGGFDGAQWILEGVRDGRYHLVDRWMPRHSDYREACVYLLELGGIDTKKLGDDFY